MAGRRRDLVSPFAARCPASKVGFLSRKDARRFAKQRGMYDLQAYLCNHFDCRYWHLGHLPTIVTSGVLDRRELTHVNRSGRSTT